MWLPPACVHVHHHGAPGPLSELVLYSGILMDPFDSSTFYYCRASFAPERFRSCGYRQNRCSSNEQSVQVNSALVQLYCSRFVASILQGSTTRWTHPTLARSPHHPYGHTWAESPGKNRCPESRRAAVPCIAQEWDASRKPLCPLQLAWEASPTLMTCRNVDINILGQCVYHIHTNLSMHMVGTLPSR